MVIYSKEFKLICNSWLTFLGYSNKVTCNLKGVSDVLVPMSHTVAVHVDVLCYYKRDVVKCNGNKFSLINRVIFMRI